MSPADYGRPALESAMVEHRYDLQYQLYSLALHWLLVLRLPADDFDRHFGGSSISFLRGMPQAFSMPGPSRELVLGLDQLFRRDGSGRHFLRRIERGRTMSGGIKSDVVIERLKALALAGRIRQLDLQFARLVADLGGSPELVLGRRSPASSWGAAMSACRWRCYLPDPCALRAGSGSGRDLLADLADPASWPALFAASSLCWHRAGGGSDPAGRCGSGAIASTSPATTTLSWGGPPSARIK